VLVVGIGDDGSPDAVEWAAAEAAARCCSLRVVHADVPGVPGTGGDLLRDAVRRVRAVASEVEVSALLLPGTPDRVLLGQSASARLLVVGGTGRPRSVPARAAARACCPVVVVPPAGPVRGPTGEPPRVVVGVGAGETGAAAVAFAFRAARRRGLPLVVVHAWTPDLPADLEAVAGPPGPAQAHARRVPAGAVRRARPVFPDVPVHVALVRGDPATTLLRLARGAALLVIGARARGRLLGPGLGPVGRAVVRRSSAPLAVVREPGGDPRAPAAGRGAGGAPYGRGTGEAPYGRSAWEAP
jgi:nucleotide-binding universal stress UspA family protein